MKSVDSVRWDRLLEGDRKTSCVIKDWALGKKTSREVTRSLVDTPFSGEFRNLVRTRGTHYGRNLARKALRYRGIID